MPYGRVIDESLDIMRWALAENDPDGWLRPDPDKVMRQLIYQHDSRFKL